MKFSLVTLLAFATMAVATPALEARTKCTDAKQFWYSSRNCCLDRGGPKVTPTPPKGRDCPRDYYWHSKQGCCTPRSEPKKNTPEPQCPKKDWKWKKSTQCCEEDDHPTTTVPPSTHSPTPQHPGNPGKDKDCDDKDKGKNNDKGKGDGKNNNKGKGDGKNHDNYKGNGRDHGFHKRHIKKSREESLCPKGLEVCPIGHLDGQFECISPLEDIRACGGCPSFGKGQDCTAITNADLVACDIGSCKVQTCKSGFVVAPDGQSCVVA